MNWLQLICFSESGTLYSHIKRGEYGPKAVMFYTNIGHHPNADLWKSDGPHSIETRPVLDRGGKYWTGKSRMMTHDDYWKSLSRYGRIDHELKKISFINVNGKLRSIGNEEGDESIKGVLSKKYPDYDIHDMS